MVFYKEEKGGEKMLSNWLKKENIQIIPNIEDWRQAIRKSAIPLLDQDIIEDRYIQAIFDMHEKVGPYYVLAPGIAMPHSRPEDGAKDVGLSLLLVKEGVRFYSDGNDPVKVIVMLAAKDSDSHIAALSALSELLGEEEEINNIINCDSVDEVFNIISKY